MGYPGGKIIHTKDFTSEFGDGFAAYAISPDNKLYVHEHVNMDNIEESIYNEDQFYHSGSFSGKPGFCFGMIKIFEGEICYIDNRSGHYKPSIKNLSYAVNFLKDHFSENAEVYASGTECGGGNLMQWMFVEEDDDEFVDVETFLKNNPPVF